MPAGILSFGSLIDDPGAEIAARLIGRISVDRTPFNVELARSSRTRDGAPTLVPVDDGGMPLPATILVLGAGEDEARAMLHRREGHRVGDPPRPDDGHAGWIRSIASFAGLDVCLYTGLEPNIAPLTVSRLAELALASAAAAAGERREDGISYLAQARGRGVTTPLSPGYAAELLARTDSRDLAEAWRRARRHA